MNKFNTQFATQKLRQEISTTSAGATFTPGTGEQTAPRATKKIVKKKVKKEGDNIPKDFTNAPSIPNRPSKGGFIYKQLFEELSKALKEAKGRIHIGTDIKTDSDIYFEPQTGAFYINIIDPAGNRTNKLQVNTIEDVLAKFPNWKWTEAGKSEFSGDLDEADATIKKEELSFTDFNHYRSDLKDAYGDLVRGNDPYAKIVIDAYNSLDTKDNPDSISKLDNAKKAIDASKNLVDQQKNYYKKAIDKIKEYLLQIVQEDEYDIYEPEEQDDDEDRYDWFTDKYEPVSDYGKYRQDPDYYEKDYQEKGTGDYFQRRGLDESYSKFKTETKTRGKSDQFHQAIREVKKKVLEINKMYEYVSRLKEELSEGEGGLEYKRQTEKALHKIKEMVSELNKKIKRFK